MTWRANDFDRQDLLGIARGLGASSERTKPVIRDADESLRRDATTLKKYVERGGKGLQAYAEFTNTTALNLEKLLGRSKSYSRAAVIAKSGVGKGVKIVGGILLGVVMEWALEQLKHDVIKAAEKVVDSDRSIGKAEKRVARAMEGAALSLVRPQERGGASMRALELQKAWDGLKESLREVEEAAGLLRQQEDMLRALQSYADRWQRELYKCDGEIRTACDALQYVSRNGVG